MTDTPDWVTLTDDEEVLWHDRPAIHPYLLGELGSLILVGIGAVLALAGLGLVALPGGFTLPEMVLLGGGGLLVAIGTVGIVGGILNWWSLRYLVTTEEVYKKRGIVSRSVTNLSLEHVRKTNFNQSVLGRFFSYGHVRISTAGTGGTEIVFRYVSDPDAVVEMITERLAT